MVKRNKNIEKLHGNYLFPEIHKKKHELQKIKPHVKIISLGIGDTTEPIPNYILSGLVDGAKRLGQVETYSGYGPEQGHESLRKKISEVIYKESIPSDEIFISDGSKCDIGRLQVMFGNEYTLAVQDPTYPAYVDTAVVVGQTAEFNSSHYGKVVYMPCKPENNFFPDLENISPPDIIYFCSPNNPTGAVATKEQLKSLVNYAKKNKAIIIFDAAYSSYIRDKNIPTSIYEIEGAREVSIELNSFSKMAGFTGVRLGWSVVPKELKYQDGYSVRNDWQRMANTFFNGASNISQAGGLAALDPTGLSEIRAQTDFYLENASLIEKVFSKLGYKVYGGKNAPYLWVYFPQKKSWDVFDHFLQKAHILATPGVGFGPSGESFLRFSAFGHRSLIEEALDRIANTPLY